MLPTSCAPRSWAIQATVEAMIDGVYEADEERLVTVNSEIQRLSRLVNALLKLSRLENRGEPMKEEVSTSASSSLASSPPTRCSCPIPASPWSTTPSPTLW